MWVDCFTLPIQIHKQAGPSDSGRLTHEKMEKHMKQSLAFRDDPEPPEIFEIPGSWPSRASDDDHQAWEK